ncbi:hypothetical protein [Sorangium atrum]|uniref:Uncharacterized protein n=1 Tax=Sorangium atrum TaxID=2995308 RepID=A0ABT5C2H7_9BACT|nr:hypothetical protein [Sorangium aterium]MDC0680610.1 hypothetical protein [Sorangium aterium]
MLGQSGCFALYSASVQVARTLADRERRHLRAIVEHLKPAHTHSVYLNGPLPPILPNPWELGLSDLGEGDGPALTLAGLREAPAHGA